MNTTLQQILNVEGALVTEDNPARNNGTLDYERSARLHNYLVAYGWMARYGREAPDLDALASQPFYFADENTDAVRERLDPSLNSFLDLIYAPEPEFFYWVNDVSMMFCDESFSKEDNLEDKPRFVVIYGTVLELGSHCLGVVYDQQLHRAAFPMTLENLDSVEPVDDHEDMWFPLETILTHWIHMLRIGKITADPREDEEVPSDVTLSRSRIGLWSWEAYCSAQVDSTVTAMDRYSAAIESRMPPESLLPVSRDTPLFNDGDLDAASVPKECFIRSVLTRVKTPSFKLIAPGLEVPHNKVAFAMRQKFTDVPRNEENWGKNIPSVLLFAATGSSRTVNFNEEIRWLFFGRDDNVTLNESDLVPTGLYSESVRRSKYDNEEAGFRLLLPFGLRPDFRDKDAARRSDGTLVTSGSFTELFQHGVFRPFGGERRAQRLERLFNRWTELIESGVWTVARDGVEGGIDKFRDADNGAWMDYWIAPDW